MQLHWSSCQKHPMPDPCEIVWIPATKGLRRLLWLLVRVMPGLFGEILPELNHVKQELEVPRCTGAFAVRRSSSVKSEPASGMRAEIPLKSEPVPATSPVQASGSPESELCQRLLPCKYPAL